MIYCSTGVDAAVAFNVSPKDQKRWNEVLILKSGSADMRVSRGR